MNHVRAAAMKAVLMPDLAPRPGGQSSLMLLVLLLLICAGPWLAGADQLIWVEGESATSKQVLINGWYDGAIKTDVLSGGAWVTNFGDKDGVVEYHFDVPAAGSYNLWVRANPIGAALSYQINDGAWVELDMGRNVDLVNLANDDKPDLRFLAWVRGGKVPLTAGATKMVLKMHSANSHHGAIDCFFFSTKDLTPAGKTHPGEKIGTKEAGWFAFEPDSDAFDKASELDLSYLNEAKAGATGFLRADDDLFKLGDGTPVRIWAANVPAGIIGKEDSEIEYLAGRLAKEGFNMVRIHGRLFDRDGNDPTYIDPHSLARYQDAVGIFNRHGIYVLLSNYYPLWLQLKDSDGITGGAIGKNPFAILFFEPRFQQLYRGWIKTIFTTKNATTGRSLSEEPGVGIVEINNEDNLFFWTFGKASIGPGPLHTLEGQFATWLVKKYGTLDQAVAAWPGAKPGDDAPADKIMGVYDAWNMTPGGMQGPDMRKRMIDQIDFFAELQHDFYAATAAFMRTDCGIKCPITGSNWITADNATLGTLDRWTYTAAGVIDKHGYFGGDHKGDWRAGFSVNAGDTYSDKCALLNPTDIPIGYAQMAHYPNIHTEIAWNKPNRFIADGDLLLSTYASIQRINGFFIFVTGDGNWENGGNGVWTLMMPGELGQCPAAALQFRRGDLKPGETVLRYVSTVKDLLALKGSGYIEGKNVDFNATSHGPPSSDPANTAAFDPLSYYVGRDEHSLEAKDTPIDLDLSKFNDHDAKTVTISTGQVVFDYGNGLLKVDSPRSQAVSGFLSKAGKVALSEVTISSGMDYGTIHVIALDQQPLASAKRILVQAFSEEKMSGWKVNGNAIVDVGHPPILVAQLQGTVAFKSGGSLSGDVLDANGMRTGPAAVSDGVLTIPANALYVVLHR